MKKYFLSFILLLSYVGLFAQDGGEEVMENSGSNVFLIVLLIINIVIFLLIAFMLFRQLNSSENKKLRSLVRDLNDRMEYNNQSINERLKDVLSKLTTIESFELDKTYGARPNKEHVINPASQNKSSSSSIAFVQKVYYGNYNDYFKGFVVDNITQENTDKCFKITQTGEKTATFGLCKVNGNYHAHAMSWDYKILPLCDCDNGTIKDDMDIEHISQGELELNKDIWVVKQKARIKIK